MGFAVRSTAQKKAANRITAVTTAEIMVIFDCVKLYQKSPSKKRCSESLMRSVTSMA